MLPCPEALRILGIWKKTPVSWDSDLGEAKRLCGLRTPRVGWGWDSTLDEASRFSELAKARPVGVYEMCHAFVEEIVCLSLLMLKNLKLKKVIKSFVPEPISCFSDSYTRLNIMYISRILVVFLYIFGPMNISWHQDLFF